MRQPQPGAVHNNKENKKNYHDEQGSTSSQHLADPPICNASHILLSVLYCTSNRCEDSAFVNGVGSIGGQIRQLFVAIVEL